MVNEIEALHQKGQPVLVGTIAIETSEMLSELLKRKGVPHNVLNAKQHEKEAGVIAQAGRPGTVTIATNMAGRGVDILLGGNAEGLARERLRKEGVDLATLSEHDHLAGCADGGKNALRGRSSKGDHSRRIARLGHRAARSPPHRQPVPRPFRPAR